ncbi:3-keto-disaccharide hydrolase [Sphingomonas sp. 3-13AW]|uniref:3-keto-disaccharide hydrolase n=1 Tax=Sphingomonas sp. 3-13AW TaxID=3050450 RepID=UPI003BB766EC
MRIWKTLAVGLLAAATVAPGVVAQEPKHNILTAQERSNGWELLFNGRDLSGWESFGGGAPAPTWKVKDGTLELTKADGKMSGTDLVTKDSYGAFELTLDWKVAPGGNSGVLYLARSVPGATQLYESGLEMQVLDDAGHSDGKIPTHRAGSLYDMTVPPAGASRPAGSWNHARLLVEPGRIRQWLNGTPTADVSYGDDAWRKRVTGSKFATMSSFGVFPSGVIGLQDHGEPVSFRNIKIRKLGATAIAGDNASD